MADLIDNVLIIDTETNGIDIEKNQVIEVGAILYSVRYQTILQQISFLLPATSNDMEKVNHIFLCALQETTFNLSLPFWNLFQNMGKLCDYVIAHNAEFDKKWFCDDGRLPSLTKYNDKPLEWLCTQDDFVFPRQYKNRMSLVDLAITHGIGISTAHRALDDCRLIAELFNRADDLQGLFEQALLPRFDCIAKVSYDDRELAKQAGFRWKAATKTWERRAKQSEIDSFPFPVTIVTADEPDYATIDF